MCINLGIFIMIQFILEKFVKFIKYYIRYYNVKKTYYFMFSFFAFRIQFNSEEQWTKALKFLLTNLKWGLAWVSSQFTKDELSN